MAEAEIGKIDKPNKPELIYDETYRHSITSSNYRPMTSLLSNIGGIPTLVEYYRQVLGASEEAITLQPDSIETYQSYTRIKGLIIKLDSEPSISFDDGPGTITEQATAFMIFDLAPIIGDVFIMDIGDGMTGLYTIAEPPRIRSYAKDKVYECDIKLIAQMTQQIEDNLNKKVVEELIYSKDSAVRGGNAVLTKDDYKANGELNHFETMISKYVMEKFFYNPEKTIILPNQEDVLYDPYLTRFLQYTIPTRKLGMRDNIRVINTEIGSMEKGGKKRNVWDMFLENNFNYPSLYKQKYYVHNSASLINTKYYGGVFFSKIDRVILTEEQGSSKDAYRYIGGIFVGNGFSDIKPGKDGEEYNYFFSDDFYMGKPTLPNEKFIYDFFRDKVIDKRTLLNHLEGFWQLDEMTQLYMSGIYLLAIRISLSTTYNYL